MSTICGMKYCDAEVRAPQIPVNFVDHTFSDDPAIRHNHQKEIPVFFLNSLQEERDHLFPRLYFFASRQPCHFLIKRAVILSVVWFRVFLLRQPYDKSVLFPYITVIQFCHLCELPFSLYFVRLFFIQSLCRCVSAWQPCRRRSAYPLVLLCARTAAPSCPAGPARFFFPSVSLLTGRFSLFYPFFRKAAIVLLWYPEPAFRFISCALLRCRALSPYGGRARFRISFYSKAAVSSAACPRRNGVSSRRISSTPPGQSLSIFSGISGSCRLIRSRNQPFCAGTAYRRPS